MLKQPYFMKKQTVFSCFLLFLLITVWLGCAQKQKSTSNKEVSSSKQNTTTNQQRPLPPMRPTPPSTGGQPPNAPPTIQPIPRDPNQPPPPTTQPMRPTPPSIGGTPPNAPPTIMPPPTTPPKTGKTDGCIDPSRKTPDVMCAAVFQPVCGCDKHTYSNECEARKNGVLKWTRGECK